METHCIMLDSQIAQLARDKARAEVKTKMVLKEAALRAEFRKKELKERRSRPGTASLTRFSWPFFINFVQRPSGRTTENLISISIYFKLFMHLCNIDSKNNYTVQFSMSIATPRYKYKNAL